MSCDYFLYLLLLAILLSNKFHLTHCRSKALLLGFIKSSNVSSILDVSEVNRILTFLRNHVFPHEELYARCFFLRVRGFDAYSNTPHEGTNRGLKYCEMSVRPNMSQAESTKVMTVQDMARAKQKAAAVSDAFHKTQLHADTATIQYIQKVAESMLQVEMEGADNYVSIRSDAKTWWVLFAMPRKQKGPIPAFERARTVHIDDHHGCLLCNCGFQDRYGLPCRHVTHVARHYGTDFHSWNRTDVDLRYHNSYCIFVATKDPGVMNEEEKSIRANLIDARQKDFSIPFARPICGYESGVKYAVGANCDEEEFRSFDCVATRIQSIKDKVVAVLNYSESEVSRALRSLKDGMDDAPGFTQESHKCDNTNDWCNDSGTDKDDDTMTFSWGPSSTPECKTSSSSAYAEAAPLWKEFMQELDEASPATRNFGIGTLKGGLIELKSRKAKRALPFCEGGPNGSIISSKVKCQSTKSTHKKQGYYPI